MEGVGGQNMLLSRLAVPSALQNLQERPAETGVTGAALCSSVLAAATPGSGRTPALSQPCEAPGFMAPNSADCGSQCAAALVEAKLLLLLLLRLLVCMICLHACEVLAL